MLNVEHDRLDYLRLLLPPDGFTLRRAIGTTYTLDLRAFNGACMALAKGILPGDQAEQNPVCLYASLREMNGRLALFYEKGLLKANAQQRKLLSLCEPLLQQVALESTSEGQSAIASFHPKIWLLEHGNSAGQLMYRFIIMSRNLTFDGSMDLAVSMDGLPTDTPQSSAAPLADFLEHIAELSEASADERSDVAPARLAVELAQAVRTVVFDTEGRFQEFEFLPIHASRRSGTAVKDIRIDGDSFPLFDDVHSKAMIISPFVSSLDSAESPLCRVRLNHGKPTLVTRRENIDRAMIDAFDCYCMRDWLNFVHAEANDDAMEPKEGDPVDPLADLGQRRSGSSLHAKAYLVEDSAPVTRDLYIGSLNASRNGVVNNVEFLFRLRLPRYRMTFEEIRDSLLGEDSLFELIRSIDVDGSDDEEAALQRGFGRAAHGFSKEFDITQVTVRKSEDPLLRKMRVCFRWPDSDYWSRFGLVIRMRPASSSLLFTPLDEQAVSRGEVEFDVTLDEVSAFFELEVSSRRSVSGSSGDGVREGADHDLVRRFIIQCPLGAFDLDEEGREQRSAAILDDLFRSSPSAYEDYIMMALFKLIPHHSNALSSGALSSSGEQRGASRSRTITMVGCYEQILKLATRDPQQLLFAEEMLADLRESDDARELLDLVRMVNLTLGKRNG